MLRPLPVTLIIPHQMRDNKFFYDVLVKNTVNTLYEEVMHMDTIIYKKLEASDIEAFITMRMTQLQEEGADAAFNLAPALRLYYEKHFTDGTFVSWVAEANGQIIATSGMSFVERPPTYTNPTGQTGVLSSMYTAKAYRRQGIAKALLTRIVDEARAYGCGDVWITAADAGVPVYEAFGFVKHENFRRYVL